MVHMVWTLLFLLASATFVCADWRMYRKDDDIVASVNYISRSSFHGKPAVWVRWHYVTPKNGVGGVKIQFAADCPKHKLLEIERHPYNAEGIYLTHGKSYKSPPEYPVTPGSINEATYKLLCY